MLATKHSKILSVRLPEVEVRRFKILAATSGVTVQEAVRQAIETWSAEIQKAPPEPLEALQGSLADIDVQGLIRQERENELQKDRRF